MKRYFFTLALFLILPLTLSAQAYTKLFAIVSLPHNLSKDVERPIGLQVSTLRAPSWQQLSWPHLPLRTFAISHTAIVPELLVGGPIGVLRPFTNATGWQLLTGQRISDVLSIAVHPENQRIIVIGTASGVFISTDNGATWVSRNKGLRSHFVSCLLMDPQRSDRILAGTESGLYQSLNGGKDWHFLALPDTPIREMTREPDSWPGILWVGTEYQGLFESYDDGKTFQSVDMEQDSISVYALAGGGANRPIYAGVFDHGLYISSSAGESWQPLPGSKILGTVFCILPIEDSEHLYVGTHRQGVQKSTDRGRTWQPYGLKGVHVRELIAGELEWGMP